MKASEKILKPRAIIALHIKVLAGRYGIFRSLVKNPGNIAVVARKRFLSI